MALLNMLQLSDQSKVSLQRPEQTVANLWSVQTKADIKPFATSR